MFFTGDREASAIIDPLGLFYRSAGSRYRISLLEEIVWISRADAFTWAGASLVDDCHSDRLSHSAGHGGSFTLRPLHMTGLLH